MENLLFNEENTFRHIKHLSTEIGSRLIGTENCKKAGNYIASYFAELGLMVKEQVFETDSVALLNHSLEILDPPMGIIPSVPFLFTPDTSEEGIIGEVLFVEEGEEASLGPQIKDKIVLWSPLGRGPVPRELSKYQPLAVIIIGQAPGIPPRHDLQHEHFFEPYPPTPSFRISWEDGYRLVQAGVRKAHLKLKSSRFPSQGRNIVAELKGSVYPDEVIVICAHYDSPPDTPSATDNASGTAIMLELARLYAQRGSKRTLRFIAFDGEEVGYQGSTYYINQLKHQQKTAREADNFVKGRDKSELEKHLFCLNLDVLGMALGFNTCHVAGPVEVTAAIKVLTKELGVPHQVFEGFYGSDNDPFSLAGIPSVTFGRMGPSFYYIHTDADTVDLISQEQLRKIGHLIDVFLQRNAAQALIWPFDRKVPEELANHLSGKLKEWMGVYFDKAFPPIEK